MVEGGRWPPGVDNTPSISYMKVQNILRFFFFSGVAKFFPVRFFAVVGNVCFLLFSGKSTLVSEKAESVLSPNTAIKWAVKYQVSYELLCSRCHIYIPGVSVFVVLFYAPSDTICIGCILSMLSSRSCAEVVFTTWPSWLMFDISCSIQAGSR